jgi:DNA-directed RNA polymerase sigma subunit (sigma70/sigma32)
MSDAEVARELGISRERVRQILLKIGPDKAIETIARTVVANAHKLGKELSLPRVIELVKSAIQD